MFNKYISRIVKKKKSERKKKDKWKSKKKQNIEHRMFEENIWLCPCLSHDKYLILWQLQTALRL